MAPSLPSFLLGLLVSTAQFFPHAQASIGDGDAPHSSLHNGDIGTSAFLVTELQRANNQSLLWGPYRPQVYFGIKPRIPESFIGGLMWAGVNDFEGLTKNFRHTCEQHDELEGYGWEEYEPRSGGRQVVRDKGNGIDLEMEYRKVEGGENG